MNTHAAAANIVTNPETPTITPTASCACAATSPTTRTTIPRMNTRAPVITRRSRRRSKSTAFTNTGSSSRRPRSISSSVCCSSLDSAIAVPSLVPSRSGSRRRGFPGSDPIPGPRGLPWQLVSFTGTVCSRDVAFPRRWYAPYVHPGRCGPPDQGEGIPGHPLDTGRVATDTPSPGAVLTMPGAPPAFHLMAKPTGATCNLDCEYCFFLSKEMLYPGSRFRMAQDLQETYIRELLEAHTRAPEVVVAWQGGEPTMMGVDFFRRSIELQRAYARPGQRILNTMQTNGTLLTDEWGAFLKENDFLVGISIDGPPQMHDAYRVDKGGKPTSSRVLRGLDVLKRHGVDWNVLTTIHAVNGDHGREVYRYLRDGLGATFIQYIPIIERATAETLPIVDAGWGSHVHGRPLYRQDGSLVTHRSVGPQQYGRFMIDVFEEWVRHDT